MGKEKLKLHTFGHFIEPEIVRRIYLNPSLFLITESARLFCPQ